MVIMQMGFFHNNVPHVLLPFTKKPKYFSYLLLHSAGMESSAYVIRWFIFLPLNVMLEDTDKKGDK